MSGRSKKQLEPLLNQVIVSLETECVRLGAVKVPRSIPTLASNSKLHFCNGLQMPEEVSASESASEIITGLILNNYSGKTRQSLATTGFAARLV